MTLWGHFLILTDLLFSIPPNYMQRLFGIEQESQQGIVTVPEWEYVRQGLTKNLNTVVDYYHRFASRMDSSHFLIKLVTAMGISRTLPLERFYAHAQARAMNTSMALGMTSSINRGVLFDGVFYGKGVKEILIAHDEDFDFNRAAVNWEWLEPIRVLSHPKSDLNINIPDGINNSFEDGIAVIAINVPMLVLQYRQWRLTRNDIADSLTESPRSIMQFLYSYPLTNMAYSHLDCAIFNRLYNLLVGAPMGESKIPHSFLLNDYSDKLTYVQRKQLEILKKVPLKFNSMMRTIPLITDKNLAKFAKLPNCAPTFQVVWGLSVARLQLLSFLFRAGGDDPRVRNASEVNRILRQFKLFRTDQALRSSLPLDLYLNAKDNLDRILLV